MVTSKRKRTQAEIDKMKEGWANAQVSHQEVSKHLKDGGSFFDIMLRAKSDKYVANMKLYKILADLRGWDADTAKNAIARLNFPRDARVKTIKSQSAEKTRERAAAFNTLMRASGGMFKSRPSIPPGWPFEGKLKNVADDIRNGLTVSIEEAMNRPEKGKPIGRKAIAEKAERDDKQRTSSGRSKAKRTEVLDDEEVDVDTSTGEISEKEEPDEFTDLFTGIDGDDDSGDDDLDFEEPEE